MLQHNEEKENMQHFFVVFQIIKVDATSFFTQKIAESLGYVTVKSVKYSEFYDENGQRIYNTESPHDYYKVMVKVLNTKSDNV